MPTTSEMISHALTDEPQSSDMLHKRIASAYGDKQCPTLTTLQSTLCSRGEKLGIKVKRGNRVCWMRFGSAIPPDEAGVSQEDGEKGKRKQSGQEQQPKRAKKTGDQGDPKEALSNKVEDLLAKPLSAFALFAFAQRATLKRQKPTASVRELVKAVGDRWLLLSDLEQLEYEAMAESERGRADKERKME